MAGLHRYARLLTNDSGKPRKDNALLHDIRCAAGSALILIAAGIAGAMVDESDHWGVRALLTLCASGTLSTGRFAIIQLQVLPTMVLAMVATAVLQMAVAAFFTGRRGLLGAASAHAGCILGMWISFLLCSRLLDIHSGVGLNAVIMLMIDAAATVSAAVSVVTIYGWLVRADPPFNAGSMKTAPTEMKDAMVQLAAATKACPMAFDSERTGKSAAPPVHETSIPLMSDDRPSRRRARTTDGQ